VLQIRIRCLFDHWIRDGFKKIKIRIRDEHLGSYFRELRKLLGLKYLIFCCGYLFDAGLGIEKNSAP